MRWRDWLGVGERRWRKAPDEEVQPAKTLWDWLQLLIVPAILIGVTFVWSATQTRSDNKREDRRIAADRVAAEEARRDATLQAYLDQMSRLMLDKKLLTTKRHDAVRAVARTVTLTALRRLSGKRKAEVVHFLFEAQLLEPQTPVVSLRGADLRGTDLSAANLKEVNLVGANLGGADIRGAVLSRANLMFAELIGADVRGATLRKANLAGARLGDARLGLADLSRAKLMFANLVFANLHDADLVGANLRSANLRSANLSDADLKGADLTGAQLGDAFFRKGAEAVLTRGLDLDLFITALPPERQKVFLDSQKAFLNSLSRKELSRFNLSPEKLARFRREAGGG
jgi:uncharacterized protein YjbI with pentapeptide repeats